MGKIFLFYLLHISLGYSKEADTVKVPDEKYQVDAEAGIFDILRYTPGVERESHLLSCLATYHALGCLLRTQADTSPQNL